MKKLIRSLMGPFLPKKNSTPFVFILPLAIAGCNPNIPGNPEPNASEVKVLTNNKDLKSMLNVEVIPGAPEQYSVKFTWPRPLNNRVLRLTIGKAVTAFKTEDTSYALRISHNQTLIALFDVLDSANNVEVSFQKEILVPRDYVVRAGQDNLTENTKLNLNRFYASSTTLKTNGFNLEIDTNEFYSKDGVIETFPENTKASLNTDGRSGGNINIKSKIATGSLKVYLRGENGGDGENAKPYTSRAKDGIPARAGNAECGCLKCPTPNYIKEIKTMMVCQCTSPSINGTPGESGATGHSGAPAKNGGDTGSLTVNIETGTAFQIQPYYLPGLAGAPGKGGEGQDGGLGSTAITGQCGARGAPSGAKGSWGNDGDLGNDGKIQLSCISIKSEGQNVCDK